MSEQVPTKDLSKKATKPLGGKAYGSIAHLPGSRMGPGDHHCHEGQATIATWRARDRHDLVIVQEKLDGSNVSVAKIQGEIVSLTRAGYIATTSPYEQHHLWSHFVRENIERFDRLLHEGERCVGEWLAQAHGTRYELQHEPFVLFDIMTGKDRLPWLQTERRALRGGFITPHVLHIGGPLKIEEAMRKLDKSGHGALDPVEGAIWRIERQGKVDFLCKFVRHDKKDGCYLPEQNGGEIVWHWRPV